jgi:hypothetical protein
MKKLTDEEIQSRLEAGENLPENDSDTAIYQLLFKELDKESNESLPLSFPANLVRKIRATQNRRADIILYIVTAMLVLTGLAGGFICLLLMDKDAAANITRIIVDYKGVWLLAISIIVATFAIDRKRIPTRSIND